MYDTFKQAITPREGATAAETLLQQLNAIMTQHNKNTGENLSVLDGLCLAFKGANHVRHLN